MTRQRKLRSNQPAPASANETMVLRALSATDAFARIEGQVGLIFSRPRGVTLQTGSANVETLRALGSAGALDVQQHRSGPRWTISVAGRARLRRLEDGGADGFSAQHSARERLAMGDGEGEVLVNTAESPLLWLHRRGALPGDAEFAAGERLRSDMTIARTMPSLSIDLGRLPGSGVAIGLAASEARVAASQRVSVALATVGPELAGVLVDVCGFLKGLELVERERGWPQRSAKLVLGLALSALARHYGLSNVAVGGPARRRQSWRAAGAAPQFVIEAPVEA